MNRILIALAVLTLLFGWTLSTPTRALPPSGSTTTHLWLPVDNLLGANSSAQGHLDTTFVAIPQGAGWVVQASFRADGLSVIGGIEGNVTGKATGDVSLGLGQTVTLDATKLNIQGGNGRLYVRCQFFVDANGEAWVQDTHVGLIGGGSGGEQ